jgi:hypothetical protein
VGIFPEDPIKGYRLHIPDSMLLGLHGREGQSQEQRRAKLASSIVPVPAGTLCVSKEIRAHRILPKIELLALHVLEIGLPVT